MKHSKLILIIFLTLITLSDVKISYTKAQVIFEDLDKDIYKFLDRMSLLHLIELNDEVKPFSRIYIAKCLSELNQKVYYLNDVEKEELKFYMQDYRYELLTLSASKEIQPQEIEKRWYLFNYEDSKFNFKLLPIASYGLSKTGNKKGYNRSIGASIYMTYDALLGLNFNIRDKGEFGDNVDKDKYLSSKRGAWYKTVSNGIEYSDLRGSITYNWNWGSVSLQKENIQWGHGKFGQLILSDKPPSYPHLRFSINPVNWFRLTYIHGWLNSLVKDSNNFYITYPNTLSEQVVESYYPKYIAANIITFTPIKFIDLSIGNAIIYSGELRPEFFIPLMFYKFLDHNTGRGNTNDGNGAMYIDVSVKYPENFQFYSTVFVDVTEVRNILSNNFKNTWIGFTLGNKIINMIFDNLDITFEYTRLNPWVYEHKDETTNYKHIKYYLGHWLGQNADQLRIQFDFQLIRGLKINSFAEYVRKGGLEEIYYAYKGMNEKNLPFLYSPSRKELRCGLNISYEYMHDLFVKGGLTHSDIKDENELRYPTFLLGRNIDLSFSLSYGF